MANYCVPETVLKGIFDLTNQIRGEYNLNQLVFSKELSFLAGEHAVHMSKQEIPYGHHNFIEREAHVPVCVNYAENVCYLAESQNPYQDIVMKWVGRPSSFARIISSFTHTGIGIAENEEGGWYCTQIFATIRTKYSKKDMLLIIAKLAGRIRERNSQPALAVSPVATANLYVKCNEFPEAVLAMTPNAVKSMFPNCSESEFISESIDIKEFPNYILKFTQLVEENSNYKRILRKKYTDIGFAAKKVTSSTTVCIIILGKCNHKYKKIPNIHMHYPAAYKCIQFINDYRIAHEAKPLQLSHQFSRIANHYAQQMMNRDTDFNFNSLAKKIMKHIKDSKVQCGVCITPMSMDPVPEIFLLWINTNKKSKLLIDAEFFGFGMTAYKDQVCYAVRIIGSKPSTSIPEPEEPPTDPKKKNNKEEQMPAYLNLSSDGEDEDYLLTHDASSSFHLTG